MNTVTQRTIFTILFLLWGSLAFAGQIPSPPQLGSEAHIIIDFNTSKTLAENNADARRAPASLTKLMTAYVVFKELQENNLTLSENTTISKKAWKTGGSRSFLEVGKQLPIEILLKGMIIQSGNDAAVALAEHIAGSESSFADLMNIHAKKLGLDNTHFKNVSGLPSEGHYSSARDVSKVAQAIIRDFPDFYEWFSVSEFTYDDIRQYNRNSLLKQKDIDGLKTGYTKAAGYCLASSAKRNGMRLISVVLGGESKSSRVSESQSLLNYGFRFYETHKLYSAGETVYESKIWKGASEILSLGIKEDLYVTIPRKTYKHLTASATLPATIIAPVEDKHTMGEVNIKLKEDVIASIPLITLTAAPEGSFWSTTVDSIKLWFK